MITSRPGFAGPILSAVAALCMAFAFVGACSGAEIALSLQTRGPDGRIAVERTTIEPSRVGIVVVDMWNYHWCKTAAMRVGSLVPRMNRVLDAARAMGMTVMLCPSDVVDNYVGWTQRERIFAMPRFEVPPLLTIECPKPQDPGGCACGRERCVVNYGWDGMHADLKIAGDDLMPDTLEDVYSLCRQRGLTHLIYCGVHTQVCLLGKPMGLRNLKAAGLSCILARDLTDAHPGYDPARAFTPDLNTSQVVEHFERYLAPSVNMAEELKSLGKWDASCVVDPVRITPWGTPMRPHLFERDVIVTLSAPWQASAAIRYTLDGTPPESDSPVYRGPFTLIDSTHVRACAFEGGKAVCLESEAEFDRLPERPPSPDVFLADLTPVRAVGPGHTYGDRPRSSAHSSPPQKDRSNEGQPLRLRNVEYGRGIGVHAPCQLMYDLAPEYARFVALAGADEHVLQTANGSNVARFPSVVFKVFLDGRLAAASPVMRISENPWRFDVPIPRGTRRISLVATDAGDGNREDRANWVNAGFVGATGRGRPR
jgi:nicotinamidase-related amidase